MKPLLSFLLIALFVPTMALGQPTHTVDLASSPTNNNSLITVTPGVPFNFYVLFSNYTEIRGFELMVNVPPDIIVLDRTLGGINAINLGSNDNFVVGFQFCEVAPPIFTLVTYTAIVFVPVTNLIVTLGPSVPSHTGGLSWLDCSDTWQLATSGRSLIVNATLDTETTSWGKIKALYAD